MTIGVVIQARMTSKRFPGKSMALLEGRPVIEHVAARAARIESVGIVVVATPYDPVNRPIWDHFKDTDIHIFADEVPENDVLSRYYHAALAYELTHIVRITGDCPYLSPKVCDEVIKMHLEKKFDYTSNVFPKRTFPKGFDCEVMSFDALEACWMMSKKAYDREHVTPWLQNTEGVERGNLLQKRDDSEINLCVDYPEDIERVPALVKMMAAAKKTKAQRKLLH